MYGELLGCVNWRIILGGREEIQMGKVKVERTGRRGRWELVERRRKRDVIML